MPMPEEIALYEAHQKAFADAMAEAFPDADRFLVLSPTEPTGPTGEHEEELDPRFDWEEE